MIVDNLKNLDQWFKKDAFDPYIEKSTICPKCKMEWKGVMGYVCMNNNCPIQPQVTY